MKICPNKECPISSTNVELDGVKYCKECGTKLVYSYKCVCGKELKVEDNFCKECGRPTK